MGVFIKSFPSRRKLCIGNIDLFIRFHNQRARSSASDHGSLESHQFYGLNDEVTVDKEGEESKRYCPTTL